VVAGSIPPQRSSRPGRCSTGDLVARTGESLATGATTVGDDPLSAVLRLADQAAELRRGFVDADRPRALHGVVCWLKARHVALGCPPCRHCAQGFLAVVVIFRSPHRPIIGAEAFLSMLTALAGRVGSCWELPSATEGGDRVLIRHDLSSRQRSGAGLRRRLHRAGRQLRQRCARVRSSALWRARSAACLQLSITRPQRAAWAWVGSAWR